MKYSMDYSLDADHKEYCDCSMGFKQKCILKINVKDYVIHPWQLLKM